MDIAEGNYDVFITLGDGEDGSVATIKAESHRLMVENITTKPGEFKRIVFKTNVRFT